MKKSPPTFWVLHENFLVEFIRAFSQSAKHAEKVANLNVNVTLFDFFFDNRKICPVHVSYITDG
jgi:hypothetical protein